MTVNRATPTAADFTYTAPAFLDYSNDAKSATVAVKNNRSGMGSVTVEYYRNGTKTMPINVGTYMVKLRVAQGDNYAEATDVTDNAWTFRIAKVVQAPLSITNEPVSITYGDTFTLTTLGGSGMGAVTWVVTNGNSATVNDSTGAVTITGVGETILTATRAADDNHAVAVTDTYTFTPAKLKLKVATPSDTGGWIKTYDGSMVYDTTTITVGSITNRVGSDVVTVSVQSASYDSVVVGSGNKMLTLTYALDGTNSENYLAPESTVVSTASITTAVSTVNLENKIAVRTDKIIEIDDATVTGVAMDGDITANYIGTILYTYYTKEACVDGDKTTVEQSGVEAIGGAPQNVGTYYVKAKIATVGNYAATTSEAAKLTIYTPSSGGGQSTVNEEKSSASILVDGVNMNMGTAQVKDGITTVAVEQNKITEELKNASESVVIPITSKTDIATAQLVVKNVEEMAKKNITLTVQSGNVSYNLNTAAIDTKAFTDTFIGVDTKKIPFNVTSANSSVKVNGANIIVSPVEFTITASYGGKTVTIDTFNSFIDRTIEITAEQAKKITTAVVVEADGRLRHIPTNVIQRGGKYYAIINSITNSTYTLIQNEVKFADVSGKWYDKIVNEMASRKIISGIGDTMFAGDRSITRAEFAAILVRALGLPSNSTVAKVFTDVNMDKWYYGAVGMAYEYGLVTGKGEDKFDPNANITRQEAMAMICRTAKVTEYTGINGSLSAFSDVEQIGTWAMDAVKFNAGSGLIVGNNGQLRPQDEISRAETAAVVLRLLQKSEFIDVRK